MDLMNFMDKKIERKKFFKAAAVSAAGFFALRSFPLNLFTKQEKIKSQKIKIEINSLAVKREKDRRNVG